MTDAKTKACKVLESDEGRRGETDDEDISNATDMQRLKAKEV